MVFRFSKIENNRDWVFQAALAFFVRILGAVAAFIATLFIARELGAEESGHYFLAFSIVSVLAAVSRGGLDNTVLRFVAADPRQAAAVYVKAIVYSFGLSILVTLFLYFVADFVAGSVLSKPALAPVLKYIAVGIPGLALLTLSANALQGLRMVSSSILVLNIMINLFLVAGIFSFDVVYAEQLAKLYGGSSVFIALIGTVIFCCYVPKEDQLAVSWSAMFSSCLPLWLVVIMSQVVQWAGQFFAGAYLNTELVAQLAVAQRTAMLASFVLIAINLVVAPRFSAHHKRGEMEALASLAKKSVVLTSVMALPIIGLMLLFPGYLMGLFGSEFVSGANLLRILAIGQFINVITGSVGFLLIMTGHERDFRNITLLSGAIALGLTWVLTANFGVIGAAVGTAIAVAAQNLCAVYFVKKRLGFNTLAVWR